MKKALIILALSTIMLQGFSRQSTEGGQLPEKQNGNTSISFGREAVKIEKMDSSFDISMGTRRLRILESLEGPEFKYERIEPEAEHNYYYNHDNDDEERPSRRFKGHWAGAELGFNGYMTEDQNISLPDDIGYMSLRSGKSTGFNINFTQLSLGLSRHVGFTTGLGLQWNNYRFSGNNNILRGSDGVIEKLDPGVLLKKSKLTTLYLCMPFMLELQLPADHNRLIVAAGPIGAVKVGSHTKMVLDDGQKIKDNGDYSLNLLRYGATARIGYENFQIFGTYYATPLFETDKGPGGFDLYPFEIGIAFTFND